jgi:hypothetical protein
MLEKHILVNTFFHGAVTKTHLFSFFVIHDANNSKINHNQLNINMLLMFLHCKDFTLCKGIDLFENFKIKC